MSSAKKQIPMPTVIAIVGVVLVVAGGVLFMLLSQPDKDTGVYRASDSAPISGRTKAR